MKEVERREKERRRVKERTDKGGNSSGKKGDEVEEVERREKG